MYMFATGAIHLMGATVSDFFLRGLRNRLGALTADLAALRGLTLNRGTGTLIKASPSDAVLADQQQCHPAGGKVTYLSSLIPHLPRSHRVKLLEHCDTTRFPMCSTLLDALNALSQNVQSKSAIYISFELTSDEMNEELEPLCIQSQLQQRKRASGQTDHAYPDDPALYAGLQCAFASPCHQASSPAL